MFHVCYVVMTRSQIFLVFFHQISGAIRPVAIPPRKGMPWWGYLLYLPFLFRAKWIEAQILLALNEDLKSIFRTPGFWLGMLEHADWFTDGSPVWKGTHLRAFLNFTDVDFFFQVVLGRCWPSDIFLGGSVFFFCRPIDSHTEGFWCCHKDIKCCSTSKPPRKDSNLRTSA